MTDNQRSRGGRENRWPLSLDTRDPEGIADFTLGLGYAPDVVADTIVRRCKLDSLTARRIVQDVAERQARR